MERRAASAEPRIPSIARAAQRLRSIANRHRRCQTRPPGTKTGGTRDDHLGYPRRGKRTVQAFDLTAAATLEAKCAEQAGHAAVPLVRSRTSPDDTHRGCRGLVSGSPQGTVISRVMLAALE